MIYSRIKRLCDAKGITIKELERRAELGNGMVAGWRESIPRADNLQRVARVLEVKMEDLMGDPEADAEAMRDLDAYEAEHGADGRLAQQRGASAW